MSFYDASQVFILAVFIISLVSFIIDLFVIIGSALLHTEPIKRAINIFFATLSHIVMWSSTTVSKYQCKVPTATKIADFLSDIPAVFYMLIAILLFFISLVFYVEQYIYRLKHINLSSLKESTDYMDKGLLIYDDTGSVFLANRLMQKLCYNLSSKALLNGFDFDNLIKTSILRLNNKYVDYNDENIIKLEDGQIYRFIYDKIEYKNILLNRIIASNVTDEFILNIELEDNIYKLRNYNEELKNYNKNIIEFTRNEELLKAKITIHDRFGELLLSTRRLDDNSTDEEKMEILDLWKSTLLLAKTGFADEEVNDELSDLLISAKNIGVKVTIDGEIPNNQIFYTMIHECLTNTVKHGNGDEMYIKCYKEGNNTILQCSNNGIIPKHFTFSGGLAGLENLVKQKNGKMYAILEERFTLVIEMEV